MKTARRQNLTIAALFAAGLALLASFETAQAADKPNILFILVDNLGYGELGAYGGGATRGAPTPSIDSLASEGFRLTNMNMETQCTPSRSSLMTGRYSIRSGTYAVPFGGVPEGLTQWEVTIAESLSAAGYATALYGKWHLGSQDGRLPNDQGFDEWYGIPRTTDESMWSSSPGVFAEDCAGGKDYGGKEGRKESSPDGL
jgi:arylsulfatase A-like enzyme